MIKLEDLTNISLTEYPYTIHESSVHRCCKVCAKHNPEVKDDNPAVEELNLCDNIKGWLLHYQEAHEFELAVIEASEK